MPKPLVLVDGSSYFFRAFHALPPLTNSKGQPTGAIYGVANMIKKLLKEQDPEHFAVIFDAKGKTFRDEWYPDYKANRPPMPEELRSQFNPLLDVLKAMGLPIMIIDGVEADDVIGTLASQATAQGLSVLISTGDKDMAQLVNDKVSLINTMTNTWMDPSGVVEKFGVKPSQIIDFLTLTGDKSDNIPGVNKCGPKTAVKWLNEYQTLDNLMTHAGNIGGKIGENLRESIPQLHLSRKLVTIRTDLELPQSIDELNPKSCNQEALIQLAQEFEFKGWLKDLLSQSNKDTNAHHKHQSEEQSFEIITTEEQLDQWLNRLQSSQAFCLDSETTSLDANRAEIVGLSFAVEKTPPAYLPLKHEGLEEQLDKSACLQALKPILENPNITKIGQNIKYDYIVFKNYNIELGGIEFDTMLESYVLDSTASRHDMDSLSLKYLGHKTISYTDIAGKGAKQLRFDQIPLEKAAPYAAEDADITLKLHQTLYPKLDQKLLSVFKTIEMPLVKVLAEIERQGVLINTETLATQGERLKAEIQALESEVKALTGKTFNLNSPKQLQQVLFEEQGLPILSKTPTGQPSTAEAVLQELAYDYRLPAAILRYRSLSKLVSTYIDALPKRINPKTHRVHTSYNQAVTATGRLSSSEPNLQNIPVRTEEGRMIRQAFIAPKDHIILAADYSQIELRIMAHLSQDQNLLTAFTRNLDIHAATASEIFGVPLDKVSSDQRRSAKAVNFGLLYGMSSFGLAKQIGVERSEAQMYIDRYFERYPGVLEYMEETRQLARAQGYVETVFGRRLHLPEINARNKMRQKAAERTAINAPMQGTAADIIKLAMIAIAKWQMEEKPKAKMIMQVHDELVFEVAPETLESTKEMIRQLMEKTVSLSVPLEVSIGTGKNWDEAH